MKFGNSKNFKTLNEEVSENLTLDNERYNNLKQLLEKRRKGLTNEVEHFEKDRVDRSKTSIPHTFKLGQLFEINKIINLLE